MSIRDTDTTAQRRAGAPPPPSRDGRVLGLDGMRGLGSICVLLYHVVDSTHDGLAMGLGLALVRPFAEALTMFFVLSGFVIFLPFVSALLRDDRQPSMTRYARARVLRIFPTYIVIFVLCSTVLQSVNVANVRSGADQIIGMMTDPGALVANLTLTQTLIPSLLSTGILPAWSLTTELGFYLAVPAMALLMVHLARRRGLPAAVAALAPGVLFVVVGTVTRIYVLAQTAGVDAAQLADLNWGPNLHAVLARSTLANADAFGYGMLVAVAFSAMRTGRISWPGTRGMRVLWATALALPVTGAVLTRLLPVDVLSACVAPATAILILGFGIRSETQHPLRSPIVRFFEWGPLRGLGTISLSFYLWHMPVMTWWAQRGLVVDSYPSALLVFAVVAASTLALSLLTYVAVEKPSLALMRGRLQFRRRSRS